MLLGWYDLLLTYRRTLIGPFWQSAQLILWAIGLGLVFKPFHQQSTEYVPYLVAGLCVWNFLSSAVISGASVFTANANLILNLPTTLLQHVVRLWTNLVLRFLFQLIVFVPVAIYFDLFAAVNWPGCLAGLVLLICFAFSLIVLAGIANAYLRDVEHLIAVVMRFLFFITPVFWIPVGTRVQSVLVKYNPFYYLLETLRQPMLGEQPEAATLAMALGLCGIVAAAAAFLFRQSRDRLTLWL